MKDVWLVDYARTAFSRSRLNQPERDVFGDWFVVFCDFLKGFF